MLSGGKLVGIITDRDLALIETLKDVDPTKVSVEDAMSQAPYTVTPVRLDAESLYWARVMCRHGIDTFAKCLEAGHWPMPVEGLMTYTLPESQSQRFSEMQFNGEIPNIERNAA